MAAKVVINDLGTSVKFTLSDGNEFVLNKINMQVKLGQDAVYVTDSGGFVDAPENKTVRLKLDEVGATLGGDPLYSTLAELFAAVSGIATSVSLGGGGVSGDDIYTNVNNTDFSATPAVGAKTITIGALGAFTLEAKNVVAGSISKIDSSGNVKTLALSNVGVSASVITLGDIDDFVSGDEVLVELKGPPKGYDEGQDSKIVTNLNPDSGKWTSEDHIVDAAEDATTLYYEIPMEGFKDLSKHWKFTGGGVVTMTLWGTNNPAAAAGAVTDWVDITADYLTKTLTISAGTIEFAEVAENLFFKKVMLRLVTTGTTNVMDVYIKKKAL